MHASIETHKCQQFLQKCDPFYCHMITIQVMTVTDVSPANQNAVGAVLQRS